MGAGTAARDEAIPPPVHGLDVERALGVVAVRADFYGRCAAYPEIIKAAWPILLAGLGNTVLLSLVVVPLGLIGGLALAMLASVRKPWVRWPLMAWVDFFRAFPQIGRAHV